MKNKILWTFYAKTVEDCMEWVAVLTYATRFASGNINMDALEIQLKQKIVLEK